ncbi:hypothetical protein BY458DRAFT_441342 [Sporodiniella umbellata]|nr:hypothetical protein BY458DRAFT_441342 [Sporodiniella umbellata]
MFNETHILKLLQTIKSTRNNAKLQQKAFQCTRDLISTHQNLIIRLIDSDSETFDEFLQSISECEQILGDTLYKEQYKVSVSCGRLLYAIAHIALSRHKYDQDAMDTDLPAMLQMEPLVLRVIESISVVEKVLQQNVENIKRNKLRCIQDLLKIKAQCCALVSNWDFDSSFKQTYHLLSVSDDQVAAVLLPYLSFLLQKCCELPQWFPENAVDELKKRMSRSSVFVNIIKLLLRTTPSNNSLTQSVVSLLYEYGSWDETHQSFTVNCWNLYLISIEAGRFGWFELMHTIAKGLDSKVSDKRTQVL